MRRAPLRLTGYANRTTGYAVFDECKPRSTWAVSDGCRTNTADRVFILTLQVAIPASTKDLHGQSVMRLSGVKHDCGAKKTRKANNETTSLQKRLHAYTDAYVRACRRVNPCAAVRAVYDRGVKRKLRVEKDAETKAGSATTN